MSTRCVIQTFRDKERALGSASAIVSIYRHSDGYPSGVIPDVLPFLKKFDKHRGMSDMEYCSARLIQHLCNKYDKSTSSKFSRYLGYGILHCLPSDIEFLYKIYPYEILVYLCAVIHSSIVLKCINTIPLSVMDVRYKWKLVQKELIRKVK